MLVCELRKLDIPFVGNKLAEHNAQIYCGLLMKTFGISLREEHRLMVLENLVARKIHELRSDDKRRE